MRYTTELWPMGHETERGERFRVFVDDTGCFWTWDRDQGPGALCSCSFRGRWVAGESLTLALEAFRAVDPMRIRCGSAALRTPRTWSDLVQGVAHG